MRREDIVQRLRQQPFQAFTIRLTDGTTHLIRHPENAFVTARNVVVGLPDSRTKDPGLNADYALVSLMHVVQIDPISDLPNESARQSRSPEDTDTLE